MLCNGMQNIPSSILDLFFLSWSRNMAMCSKNTKQKTIYIRIAQVVMAMKKCDASKGINITLLNYDNCGYCTLTITYTFLTWYNLKQG